MFSNRFNKLFNQIVDDLFKDDFFSFETKSNFTLLNDKGDFYQTYFEKLESNPKNAKFIKTEEIEVDGRKLINKVFDNGSTVVKYSTFISNEENNTIDKQKQLEEAVKNENYELAARLQKEIKNELEDGD